MVKLLGQHGLLLPLRKTAAPDQTTDHKAPTTVTMGTQTSWSGLWSARPRPGRPLCDAPLTALDSRPARGGLQALLEGQLVGPHVCGMATVVAVEVTRLVAGPVLGGAAAPLWAVPALEAVPPAPVWLEVYRL
ncbi:hypothetical protein ACWGII_41225 [Streptomyces sp. NPDC054855]